MNELDDLSLDEMWQIVNNEPATLRARKLLEKAHRTNGLLVLRDDAFSCYWAKKTKAKTEIADDEIARILNYPELPRSNRIIGEFAQRNMLTKEQCDSALPRMEKTSWGYLQVLARSAMQSLHDGRIQLVDLIDQLLDWRTYWAVMELVPLLSYDEILVVENYLKNDARLPRRYRHMITQLVKDELKRRK